MMNLLRCERHKPVLLWIGVVGALTWSCGDDGALADAGTAGTAGSSASAGPVTDTGLTGSVDSSDGPATSTAGSESDTTADPGTDTGEPPSYPDPGDHPPNIGPGGPSVTLPADALYANCAFIDGGPSDSDHHNLVVMFDGYLMMPWAPEYGGGGLSFYDFSDPCAPVTLSSTVFEDMRETHATGIASVDERYYAVVAAVDYGLLNFDGGIMLIDVTNVAAPAVASTLDVPGHLYPDAYARVVLSASYQAPYIYIAGADNGIFIVDASDPAAPVMAGQYNLEPTLRVGQVNAVGNLLVATAAEGPRTVLLDISVPDFPQPIAGGDFEIIDSDGMIRESYFSNVGGGYVYYAIKNGMGGLLMVDIHDPSAPALAGHFDSGGNGGYVFRKDDLAFVGESSFAGIYDVSDPAAMSLVTQLDLEGDLDTATPIGNVVVLSVDDEANPGEASAVAPYDTEPDAVPPRVTWSVPGDGAADLPVTSRVGVTLSEMVDVKSAWYGSVRLYRSDGDGAPVVGHISVQENVINFSPEQPLAPGGAYTFEIPAGGVADYNGNAIEEPFSITFTTLGG